MRLHWLSSLLLSAAAALAAADNAAAASSIAVSAGEAKVRLLVSGSSDTISAPIFRGGVEIVLSPGWKTYWRYPGDAGIPPRFDWSGSDNVAEVEVLYPAPKRITDGSGQASIGYEERVIFPLRIRASNPNAPVSLKLKLDFATCEKLCIPAEAIVSLSFDAMASVEPALAAAQDRVPKRVAPGDVSALSIVKAKVERGTAADGNDKRILVIAQIPAASKAELFAEGPSEEWTLALPELVSSEAGRATFAIPLDGARLGRTEIPPKLRLTLIAGEQSIETEIVLD